ncbi:hypothetical protein DDE82_007674 [Stemphylium lycopersici]|nr:hypothetical protein TW65_01690 [Stemphylium lycopersici]RAR00008.1 hypothetical protein DDE82_007674 [Stemphylium lycopersici]
MHIPTHSLQLRPKSYTTSLPKHHSQPTTPITPTSSIQTPQHDEAKPAHRQRFKIKEKRNIKLGVAVLRTVSKWTDKAASTLEKLEVQDTTSANGREREREIHLNAVGGTVGEHDHHAFRETVVSDQPSTKEEVARSELGAVRGGQVQVIEDGRAAEMTCSEEAKADSTLVAKVLVCQVHESAAVVAETEAHHGKEYTDSESESADTSDEGDESDDDSDEDSEDESVEAMLAILSSTQK